MKLFFTLIAALFAMDGRIALAGVILAILLVTTLYNRWSHNA